MGEKGIERATSFYIYTNVIFVNFGQKKPISKILPPVRSLDPDTHDAHEHLVNAAILLISKCQPMFLVPVL